MGKIDTRLPSFCLNRIRPHVRVRSPPITIQSKNINRCNDVNLCSGTKNEQKLEEKNTGDVEDEEKEGGKIGRKIMIVVDSSFEAKSALLWALSHSVQTQDVVILLHVIKPSNKLVKNGEVCTKERASRGYAVVNSLKTMSQVRRPEIEIETRVVEGKEKGPLIVEEANKQGAALLVIGQKKRSMTWRLIMMWATNKMTSGSVVEYCIQNAPCMAVAVRRKSKKHGGFLITTKRHKDFWLLA